MKRARLAYVALLLLATFLGIFAGRFAGASQAPGEAKQIKAVPANPGKPVAWDELLAFTPVAKTSDKELNELLIL
jgi:hypothetical protein